MYLTTLSTQKSFSLLLVTVFDFLLESQSWLIHVIFVGLLKRGILNHMTFNFPIMGAHQSENQKNPEVWGINANQKNPEVLGKSQTMGAGGLGINLSASHPLKRMIQKFFYVFYQKGLFFFPCLTIPICPLKFSSSQINHEHPGLWFRICYWRNPC